MIEHFRLKAPGNLLLCGEFSITQEGGKGVTLAPNIYAFLEGTKESEASSVIRFYGKFGRQNLELSFKNREDFLTKITQVSFDKFRRDGSKEEDFLRLVSAVYNALSKDSVINLEGYSFLVDTSNFYYEYGRKMGLGSSAASTSLLIAAFHLIQSSSETIDSDFQNRIFLPAVHAHRDFQFGAGSAYDIAASIFGSVGLFTGGPKPSWKETPKITSILDQQTMLLTAGKSMIATVSSIESFQKALVQDTKRTVQLLEALSDLSMDFESIETEVQFYEWLEGAKSKGIELGDCINVPSVPKPLNFLIEDYPELFIKCLGAGDEVILGIMKNTQHNEKESESKLPQPEKSELIYFTRDLVGITRIN
jgi:phosphomevalonate kinase